MGSSHLHTPPALVPLGLSCRERSPGRRISPENFLSGNLVGRRIQRHQEMGRENDFSRGLGCSSQGSSLPAGELGQPRSREGFCFLPGALRQTLFPCTERYFSGDACWGCGAVET